MRFTTAEPPCGIMHPVSASPPSKRRDRRQEILAATCVLVVSDGIDGLRSATVAAEAGTSVGLVHYHYPTLDDLVLAAYVWDQERTWDPFAGLDPAADPLGTLELLLAGQLSQPESEVRAGFMLWQEYARRALFDERIHDVVVRRITRWIGVMAELVGAAAERGEYADAAAAELASARFAATLFGASVLHLTGLIPVGEAAADMSALLAASTVSTTQPAVRAAEPPQSPAAAEPADPPALLLAATLRLIARGGVRAVHFAEVAEEAGFSTALPRYYYATMDGLLLGALQRLVEQRRERVQRLVAATADPAQRVRGAVLAQAAFDLAEGRDERVILHEFLRLGFVHETFRPAVCAALQEDIDVLARLIADVPTAAGSPADASVRQLVESINGVMLGSLLGILDDAAAVRVLDWAVVDALGSAG